MNASSRDTHNKFASVLRRYQDKSLLINEDDVCVYVSEPAAELLGATPEQVLGVPLIPFLNERSDEVIPVPSTVVTDVDRCPSAAYRITTPHGPRWIEVCVTVLRDERNGGGTLVTLDDATVRREEELHLRESERKFRLLADKATELIVRQSHEGVSLYVSPSVERMLGVEPSQAVGRSVTEFMPPDSANLTLSTRKQLLDTGKPSSLTHQLQRADGSHIWAETTYWLIPPNNENDLPEIYSISRDVSDRVAAEKKLEEHLALQSVITESSARFVDVGTNSAATEEATEDLLAAIGNALSVDATFIATFEPEGLSVKSLWTDTHLPKDFDHIAKDAYSRFPHALKKLTGGLPTWFGHPTELSPTDRRFVDSLGIVAQITLPLRHEGNLIGWFTALSFTEPHEWPSDTVSLLRTAADVVAHTIVHQRDAIALKRSEGRFKAILNKATDGFVLLRADGTIQYQSPAVGTISGQRDNKWKTWQDILTVVHPDDVNVMRQFAEAHRKHAESSTIQCRIRHQDRTWKQIELTATNQLKDPELEGVVVHVKDITERQQYEEDLLKQAHRDELTGLVNRSYFITTLKETLSITDEQHAILFVDVDRFKIVNDTRGHQVGDQLLIKVAERLHKEVREEDTVARFGGDEFIILCRDIQQPEEAEEIATRIRKTMEAPIVVDNQQLYLSVSIGVATSKLESTFETLISEADVAMDAAKLRGRDRIARFTEEMAEVIARRHDIETELHSAISNNEFVMLYQPILDLKTNKIIGAEALIRWQHPTEGLLTPYAFLDVAEDSGLIVPIGQIVLREAAKQAVKWSEQFGSHFKIHVNLSGSQLREPGFLEDIDHILDTTKVEPHNLCFEITESVLVAGPEAEDALLGISERMIPLAIDDFGTGHSSLVYLQQFHVDSLKVDRSFVSKITEDDNAKAIVNAVVNLSHALGLSVVAEGVEEQEQLAALIDMGCDEAQGYLFGKPLHVEDFPTDHS